MARDRKRQQDTDLQERVVFIHRVSKTVKGGRRMSLVALVAVGDGKGNVGLGMGKSAEVPLAIQKGVEDAKKNMFKVPVTEHGTIPHAVEGHYGAGHVLIKPAIEGTGVIAGGPVRPLFELAGITNVLSKSLGTSNAMNIIKAAAEGLKELSSPAGELTMAQSLKIKLVRSAVASVKKDQTATCRALGLRKIGDVVEQPDNPSIRGMIFKVKHLVVVEEN